jgi:hypothetical protein
VSDVGGLVGVDAGVLDDHAPRHGRGGRVPAQRGRELASERGPVQGQVQVASTRHLRTGDAGRTRDLGGERRRDLAGRSPQRLGQLERRREREVPELQPGRVLEGQVRQLCRPLLPDHGPHVRGQPFLKGHDHRASTKPSLYWASP